MNDYRIYTDYYDIYLVDYDTKETILGIDKETGNSVLSETHNFIETNNKYYYSRFSKEQIDEGRLNRISFGSGINEVSYETFLETEYIGNIKEDIMKVFNVSYILDNL